MPGLVARQSVAALGDLLEDRPARGCKRSAGVAEHLHRDQGDGRIVLGAIRIGHATSADEVPEPVAAGEQRPGGCAWRSVIDVPADREVAAQARCPSVA